HELAHVLQQRGTSVDPMMKADDGDADQLEREADRSAVSTVVSLWRGLKGGLAQVSADAVPRLKSGLRLQRCSRKDPVPTAAPQIDATKEAVGKKIAEGMGKANAPGDEKSGIHYAHNYEKDYPGSWKEDYKLGLANPDYFERVGWMHWRLK